MASNVYECMFILDSNKYARNASAVSGTIAETVEKVGGELLANRLWAEQKLAYPIKGHRKGTYWLTYFRLDSSKLAEFNRLCRLNEHILRYLVLKVDPRLVEPLVSHALGKSKREADEEAGESRPAQKSAGEGKTEEQTPQVTDG